MNSLGKFKLVGSDNGPVECSIEWMADPRDWSFVDRWEKEPAGNRGPRLRDSIDYARTGAKRWRWLSKKDAVFQTLRMRLSGSKRMLRQSSRLPWPCQS